MTRTRIVAAIAAMFTALLLQATVVAPITLPVPVSLPALLVAGVALADGPGAGLAFGFTTGLLADLGSTHPAGVLALCWAGVGLLCGLAVDRASVRRDAALAAIVCALAALAAGLALTVLGAGGASVAGSFRQVIPAGLGDALLALAVVPVTRAFLRSPSLRASHPVLTELDLAGQRD